MLNTLAVGMIKNFPHSPATYTDNIASIEKEMERVDMWANLVQREC
jgi:hypothetical protein